MTSTILIRELDGTAPETVDLLLPVLKAAAAHDMVGHPEPTREMLSVLLGPRGNQVATVFAAFDEHGVPAMYARVGNNTRDNVTLAYGTMWSDPARRREGFGSALLPRLQEWARARGCDRLVLDAPATEGALPFAAKHGGRLVGTDKRSMLDLRKVDRAQYEQWAAPSEANAEFRTVRWAGAVPDDLVESYVRARNAMDDAPHGELELEFPQVTVEEQRETEAIAAARGLVAHVLAAVAPDGVVVGYTQVYAYPGTSFRLANIGDTAVVAAHRGHGLGLRLKAEQTLWVMDELPHVDVIDTWNNEDNAPMLRVNVLMGYEFAELWQGIQFEL
jgi:GNAT superfamily N-acetyltransferase